jgi:hypothetical protein
MSHPSRRSDRIGSQFQRVVSNFALRLGNARSKISTPPPAGAGGTSAYKADDLASDLVAGFMDLVDFWTSGLPGDAMPTVVLSSTAANYNAGPANGQGTNKISQIVSLEDQIDPNGPAPTVLRDLFLLGTPTAGSATSLDKAAVTVALDNGGYVLSATLQRPAAGAANNNAGPGIYQSVLTLNAGAGLVAIANVEIVLG